MPPRYRDSGSGGAYNGGPPEGYHNQGYGNRGQGYGGQHNDQWQGYTGGHQHNENYGDDYRGQGYGGAGDDYGGASGGGGDGGKGRSGKKNRSGDRGNARRTPQQGGLGQGDNRAANAGGYDQWGADQHANMSAPVNGGRDGRDAHAANNANSQWQSNAGSSRAAPKRVRGDVQNRQQQGWNTAPCAVDASSHPGGGGSSHGGSHHGGSHNGGSQQGGNLHGGSHHGGSLQAGSLHGGSQHFDRGSNDGSEMQTENFENSDISGVVESLLEYAQEDTNRGVSTSPKLHKMLSRLYGLFGQVATTDASIQPSDLGDIAWALGRLQVPDLPLVIELTKKIADIAKWRAERFSPYDMANTAWGFASLSLRDEQLMSVIAAEVVNKIDGFDQRQLSNTAWAFATSGLWNEQLVTCIAAACLGKIQSFTPASLSHISWAMAQWGTRNIELMRAVAVEAELKTGDFQPAQLSMIAWAFASLQIKEYPSLMSAISEASIGKISEFKTQDLAHLAWAFANLRITDPVLFKHLAESIQRNIKEMLPPELANIAWAFSKNNMADETLMNAVATEATDQMIKFKPSELAMLTWAYAVAGLQNKTLFNEIGTQVAKRIDKFTAQQLSHIAWAFGALSLRHSDLLTRLSTHVYRSNEPFKAQPLSNIAWSFAMLTFRDESLLRRVASDICRDVHELRPLSLARCAWAYRVLAVHCPDLLSAIAKEALGKVSDFTTKALVKLVDSLYMSTRYNQVLEHALLEQELARRAQHVATFLRDTWVSPESLASTDIAVYTESLSNFGLPDFGVVGTPLLLQQLDIQTPGSGFMKRCQSKVRKGDAVASHRNANPWMRFCAMDANLGEKELFTVAEIDVTVGVEKLEQWVVKHLAPSATGQDNDKDQKSTSQQPVTDDETAARHSNRRLIAVSVGGQTGAPTGKAEATFQVLDEVSHLILEQCDKNESTQESAEACKEVRGEVRLLSTVIPCLSSVSALQQFTVLFPNICLQFVEQVRSGAIGDQAGPQ